MIIPIKFKINDKNKIIATNSLLRKAYIKFLYIYVYYNVETKKKQYFIY